MVSSDLPEWSDWSILIYMLHCIDILSLILMHITLPFNISNSIFQRKWSHWHFPCNIVPISHEPRLIKMLTNETSIRQLTNMHCSAVRYSSSFAPALLKLLLNAFIICCYSIFPLYDPRNICTLHRAILNHVIEF